MRPIDYLASQQLAALLTRSFEPDRGSGSPRHWLQLSYKFNLAEDNPQQIRDDPSDKTSDNGQYKRRISLCYELMLKVTPGHHLLVSRFIEREKMAIVPERQLIKDILIEEASMRLLRSAVFSVCMVTLASPAPCQEWQRFVIPSTGTSVDMPASIFTEQTELPDRGVGRRFFTSDRRADLTVQSIDNPGELSPSKFLAQRKPPPGIQYRRVTRSFFVVSSTRKDRIWYNRCNRAPGRLHCVLINYPAGEERQWDSIVTRISLSLRPLIRR